MAGTYVGGTRDRLIHDSLYNYVKGGLGAIGWFNSGRQHAPLDIIPEQKDWDTELEPNTITIAPAGVMDEEWELGSFGNQNTTVFYIDVYGENEALGLQISGDIRDILRGKFATLGYGHPTLPVFDYTQATPTQIFYCDIEGVRRDRAQNFPHRWQKYLYVVKLEVVDYYTDDETPVPYQPS